MPLLSKIRPSPTQRGGSSTVSAMTEDVDLFHWPLITSEDEKAVLDVLRRGAMSGLDETEAFEQDFAGYQGVNYAVGYNNGTAAIQAAMFACGVEGGTEVIGPSLTYWASVLPARGLGAKIVFAEVDPESLCIDPNDIEHRITSKTRAIVAVHAFGHPADMDRILSVARRHGLKVIEDFSHAQGGHYKGRRVGSIGDVGAASLMSKKSLAAGEAGMLVTDDLVIRDMALAWGHHKQFDAQIDTESLRPFAGLPLGGIKGRMHQLSAAVGRVQLRHYDARCDEIRRAMDRFWHQLDGVCGLRPHRTTDQGSDMAGWYSPTAHYDPKEFGGLSVSTFARAVRAEGSICGGGGNRPLHLHPLFASPVCANPTTHPVVLPSPGSLPITEAIGGRICKVPWFKHDRPEAIEWHAAVYRKVAENYEQLLPDDLGDPPQMGSWTLSAV